MDPITWEMRYGLPNREYAEFVALYLLPEGGILPSVDPFTLVVPASIADDVYVERQGVEDDLDRRDAQIVLGRKGSGKTTLFGRFSARLQALPPNRILIVPLSRLPLGDRVHLLDFDALSSAIFNAYWQDLLHNSSLRSLFLLQLRRNRQWMAQLRWFYHRYPPLHPDIPEEFELMAWLDAGSADQAFGARITAEEVLQALVDFVISSPPKTSPPYNHVQILIDDVEHFSDQAGARVIQGVQRLHHLGLGSVSFKLFADVRWREPLERLDCVQCGRVAVYLLPQWRDDELRQILCRRLTAWAPGEYDGLDEPIASHVQLARLRELLVSYFDEAGLRALCFDLGLNYEDLSAQGREDKARELVAYLDRRDRVPDLIAVCERLCPDVRWRAVLGLKRKGAECDWGRRIPASHLTRLAQERLIEVVVDGALRAYQCEDEWDAPVHALRLARALVAACAGCWAAQGYAPPLNADQLYTLVDLYWKS
jgi:hypothetical protein